MVNNCKFSLVSSGPAKKDKHFLLIQAVHVTLQHEGPDSQTKAAIERLCPPIFSPLIAQFKELYSQNQVSHLRISYNIWRKTDPYSVVY